MSFKAFILKIIKSNLQKYSWFLLSTVFSMSIFFIFINLCFTKGFQNNTNSQMKTLMTVAETVTILFSVYIISYVHWYLMQERAKSFSILLSYGMTQKALQKLIIGETLLIYTVSLCLAFITGSVFSKLFFMMSTKLLMISNENLKYQLTIQSYLATAAVFAVIFAVVLLISLIRIRRKDLIKLAKSNGEVELNRKGNAWAGCLGLLLTGGSVIALYLHNHNSTLDTAPWILGSGFITLIGIYLVISHFSRIIYGRLKNSKKYYANLLAASEFAKEYRQNRKTLFVLTLLTFGILFFISITYTLYTESYRFAKTENPHDLYYQQLEAIPEIFDAPAVNHIFQDSETTLTQSLTLPFIYMAAPEMRLYNWRSWKVAAVVSESAYNSCFHSNYSVNPGETIQIIFESTLDRIQFFDDNILLKNDAAECRLKSSNPVYQKILNRYVFAQPFLLIVDDSDYKKFAEEATSSEKGLLHMYSFQDWTKSSKVCSKFTEEFYNQLDGLLTKDNRNLINGLIDRYGYSFLNIYSKISYYEANKMQGSFSLFIMGFVSILFAFCILNTLCFKVFLSASQDSIRFKKLDGIGMTGREKRGLIASRIKLIMLVPTFLGIVIDLLWSYALNFKVLIEVELSDFTIIKNSVTVSGIYVFIMLIYYHILKSSYLKRLNL